MPQEVRFPLPDGGSRRGFLALPDGPGPHPGVIVIHDIFGLTPDSERHCRRFAEAGYAALAPDVYGGGVGCVVKTLTQLKRGEGAAFDALAAARAFLAERPEVDAARLGVTGFCMGGGFALLVAADHTYAVAAPFYGDVPKRAERLRGLCPTLAQFGETDLMFIGHARRLERHLAELDVPHEVIVYPGIGHSFMNDHGDGALFALGRFTPMRAAYDAETEAVAWGRLLDFFARHMPAA